METTTLIRISISIQLIIAIFLAVIALELNSIGSLHVAVEAVDASVGSLERAIDNPTSSRDVVGYLEALCDAEGTGLGDPVCSRPESPLNALMKPMESLGTIATTLESRVRSVDAKLDGIQDQLEQICLNTRDQRFPGLLLICSP